MINLSEAKGKFNPFPRDYAAVALETRLGVPSNERSTIWLYLCCEDTLTSSFVDVSLKAAMNQVFHSDTSMPSTHAHSTIFGEQVDFSPYGLTTPQIQSFHRLCTLFHHLNGITYCPNLVHLLPIFLVHTSEAVTFVAISSLLKHQRQPGVGDEYRKLPMTRVSDMTLVRLFKDILQWRFPDVIAMLKKQEADDESYFLCTFHRFFVGLLPLPVVYRVVDAYLADGPKVLCRILLSVFKLTRRAMASCTATSTAWWEALAAHIATSLDFDKLFLAAFRTWYGYLFKKSNIREMHRSLAKRTSLIMHDSTPEHHHTPLSFINPRGGHLLHATRDAILTSWLPPSLQMKKFRLLYDAEVHGRHLDRLYSHCKKSNGSMLLLVQVLSKANTIIGVFTSHPLTLQSTFFGDHRCFAFTLTPTPAAFRLPTSPRGHAVLKYMMCQPTLLSIGVSATSSDAALELDEELMRGKSGGSDLFMCPPLAGDDAIEFDVGSIEVYDFVL